MVFKFATMAIAAMDMVTAIPASIHFFNCSTLTHSISIGFSSIFRFQPTMQPKTKRR